MGLSNLILFSMHGNMTFLLIAKCEHLKNGHHSPVHDFLIDRHTSPQLYMQLLSDIVVLATHFRNNSTPGCC